KVDSPKDATAITWTVDITNGDNESLTNGVLADTLPEGVGDPRDFVIREISYDRDGNEIIGEPLDLVGFDNPNIGDGEFTWDLGTIPGRSGYRIEYTTSIEDYTISKFTNDATFESDQTNLEDDA